MRVTNFKCIGEYVGGGEWAGKFQNEKKQNRIQGGERIKSTWQRPRDRKENPISAPSIQVGAPVDAGSLRPK